MDLIEFVEFLDEIVDYERIKAEYSLSYSEIKQYFDRLASLVKLSAQEPPAASDGGNVAKREYSINKDTIGLNL